MAHVYDRTEYRSPVVWHNTTDDNVPDNAVRGGTDETGELLLVGRACMGGDCIPGKVVRSHGVCYIPYDSRENPHREYQVLTNPNGSNLEWVPASDGQIPHGAIQGGEESDGERLYIGRGEHKGSVVVGKVHPRHGVLYIPYGGQEVKLNSYEVLVIKEIAH